MSYRRLIRFLRYNLGVSLLALVGGLVLQLLPGAAPSNQLLPNTQITVVVTGILVPTPTGSPPPTTVVEKPLSPLPTPTGPESPLPTPTPAPTATAVPTATPTPAHTPPASRTPAFTPPPTLFSVLTDTLTATNIPPEVLKGELPPSVPAGNRRRRIIDNLLLTIDLTLNL